MDFVAAMDSASVNVSIGQVGVRSASFQLFWGMEGVFRRWSCGEPRRARELHKGRASARATPRTAVQFTSPASCPSALKAIN